MGDAMLIIGPTGAGKTPLGRLLHEKGYQGRECYHIDFGEELRSAAAGDNILFNSSEMKIIKGIIDECKLLDESTYWIAERILESYQQFDGLVVLNGIPRKVEQALGIDRIFGITDVVVLEADLDTIISRINKNTGGDRTGRDDDCNVNVCRKWDIYNQDTRPLIAHYAGKGSRIITIDVTDTMTCDDMYSMLHENS